jgi:hypothetical protein
VLNILLSCLIGLVVLGLAVLGGYITARTRLQRYLFVSLGVIGIALIAWQSIRTQGAADEAARAQRESARVQRELGRQLQDIGTFVKKMAQNAPETGHAGELHLQEGAVQATIVHGYDDPRRSVVVYPLANWNTVVFPVSQDRASITFVFAVPAPRGAMLAWKASRSERSPTP